MWVDWPARRAPRRALLTGVVIALTVLGLLALDPLMALVGALLLLGATAEVLLPSHYRLDDRGVTIDRALWSRQVPWSKFQGWSPAPEGFLLHGAGSRALLRRRRTLRLHCPHHQDGVEAVLLRCLE